LEVRSIWTFWKKSKTHLDLNPKKETSELKIANSSKEEISELIKEISAQISILKKFQSDQLKINAEVEKCTVATNF